MYKGTGLQSTSPIKIFLLICLIIFSTEIVSAQSVYYVSSQGDDSKTGISESSAWRTIGKVNSVRFNPGDIVNFKSGQKFWDAVLDCKTGVTYTTYGGSAKAVIGDSVGTEISDATIQINNENVTIRNLKIYGYANAARVIVYTKGGLTIDNCEIIGGKNSHDFYAIGIKCNANDITKQVNITHNIIRDFYKGMYFNRPYNIDVSYNIIYNIFRWDGYQNIGGMAIQSSNNGLTDAFNCAYTFHIHHNEIYNFEHSALGTGSVSRVLIEYNYIHDNLDERLYMGGMKHGTVGKFYDNTDLTTGAVGTIFRYNYVYNLYRRGLAGYTYGRPTIANIKAGIPNVISSGGSNTMASYVTSEGGTFSGQPDAILSGLGYGNVWVHNNIFYKSDHQVLNRGYTKFDPSTGLGGSGNEGAFRTDLPAYFVNNTVLDYGDHNTGVTDQYGLIYGEVSNQAPTKVYNNIFDLENKSALTAGIYKEDQTSVDYNIYPQRTGVFINDVSDPPSNSNVATWWRHTTNLASGNGEKYLTSPDWIDTSSKIFITNIGPSGVYIPDVRIKTNGNAYNTGKVYDTIGDTYTDIYGTHQMGKDPTGRSFAYDILGNLRATNDIGAVGSGNDGGLKVILEAAFQNGQMETTLSASNLLPLNQPYSVSPWNVNDNSILNHVSPNYVDWILVQLKDNLTSTKYSKAAILTKYGTVINSDGTAFSFSNITSGQYYIVIRHRNHISIMSSTKIQINNNEVVKYDFTDSQSKAYGDNSMADLGNGKYGMIAGDDNADGIVNDTDFTLVSGNIFAYGYTQGDVDMNGVVNVLDYYFINKNMSKSSNSNLNISYLAPDSKIHSAK